jgi:hypothetical protein
MRISHSQEFILVHDSMCSVWPKGHVPDQFGDCGRHPGGLDNWDQIDVLDIFRLQQGCMA